MLSPFAGSGTGSSEKRNQGSPGYPLEKGLVKAFCTGKDLAFFNAEKRNASHSDECRALLKGQLVQFTTTEGRARTAFLLKTLTNKASNLPGTHQELTKSKMACQTREKTAEEVSTALKKLGVRRGGAFTNYNLK